MWTWKDVWKYFKKPDIHSRVCENHSNSVEDKYIWYSIALSRIYHSYSTYKNVIFTPFTFHRLNICIIWLINLLSRSYVLYDVIWTFPCYPIFKYFFQILFCVVVYHVVLRAVYDLMLYEIHIALCGNQFATGRWSSIDEIGSFLHEKQYTFYKWFNYRAISWPYSIIKLYNGPVQWIIYTVSNTPLFKLHMYGSAEYD